MSSTPTLCTSDDLLICNACGTQYNVASSLQKTSCAICDDPRQFVPPSGQSFTTMAELKKTGHRNLWKRDPINPAIWSIWTDPNFAIGQRAMLIQTPHGNILWDMVALLDQPTIDKIESLGGLAAIAISHPHYYTTHADWSATFPNAPIYIGAPDRDWLVPRPTAPPNIQPLTSLHTTILPGVTAILSGGHFPGSLCLHWQSHLFIADTIFTVPSARNPIPGKKEVISYTFWYSVPNRIPLSPAQTLGVWKSVRDLEFHTTFGAFVGMDVRSSKEEVEARRTGGVKGRMLESVKIFVGSMGWVEKGEGEREAVREIMREKTAGSAITLTPVLAEGSGTAEASPDMRMDFEL